MESSATQAIYTGTYIFVFVAALTISLYLFNSILNFSNVAYEFEGKIEENEVIVDVPVEANRLLSADEVASYYYNYIVKDQYINSSDTRNSEIEKYNVVINTGSGNNLLESNGVNKRKYGDVINALGKDNKYILKYDSIDSNGKIKIIISKATEAQIKQMQ